MKKTTSPSELSENKGNKIPENKGNLDPRGKQEQETKGTDITHNEKQTKEKHLKEKKD
jgi:hypothetical protein